MKHLRQLQLFWTGILAFLGTPLLAHTLDTAGNGFTHGIHHPFLGLDHVLAMLAVGVWAYRLGGAALWKIPVAFAGMMLAGVVLGLTAVPLPLVEPMIAASVLVLGLLIATARRPGSLPATAVIAVFAVFHGYAHGAILPSAMAPIAYESGLVMATLSLHLAGIGLGWVLSRTGYRTVRACGVTLAGAGVVLLLGV